MFRVKKRVEGDLKLLENPLLKGGGDGGEIWEVKN